MPTLRAATRGICINAPLDKINPKMKLCLLFAMCFISAYAAVPLGASPPGSYNDGSGSKPCEAPSAGRLLAFRGGVSVHKMRCRSPAQ